MCDDHETNLFYSLHNTHHFIYNPNLFYNKGIFAQISAPWLEVMHWYQNITAEIHHHHLLYIIYI